MNDFLKNNKTLNSKKLLLIDGIGAIVSAFFLGVILVIFESHFGMPKNVLYVLAGLACLFAIYSITCYLRIEENWKPYLKFISIVNLLYCCLTMFLVFQYYQQLTALGLTYFILEILIIIGLVIIERKGAL